MFCNRAYKKSPFSLGTDWHYMVNTDREDCINPFSLPSPIFSSWGGNY